MPRINQSFEQHLAKLGPKGQPAELSAAQKEYDGAVHKLKGVDANSQAEEYRKLREAKTAAALKLNAVRQKLEEDYYADEVKEAKESAAEAKKGRETADKHASK